MKKIILILTFLLFASMPVFATAVDNSDTGAEGLYQYSQMADNPFVGQKQISDEDFQKMLAKVKEKQNKRKKTNKPFKGQSYNEENNGGYVKDSADKNAVLTLPITLNSPEGTEIPIGMYKVVGKRVNDKIYLDFYQGYSLIARVPATETNDDFDEKDINFVKMIPQNKNKVEVIYGSMDFNAYAFINIKQ